ncbi:MAG: tRNA (adenine(22)-N(1))-methyltransferase TrmK, partial [Eubacteriales bacterium]|nr:tRNA (adenine(22)-N(1))-methyltransferase TrmK [Eubacteriales bacterium]
SLKLFVADGFRGHHFMQHDIACLMGIGGYTALYILKDLASLVQTTELEELDLVIQIQSKVPEFRSALRLLNCIPLREILLEEEGFHYQIFYYQLNFNRELFSAWRALPDPTLGRRENPAFREYLEGDQEIEDFFLSKVSRCELAERAKSDRVLREFLELFYERQGRHYYQTSLGRHNLAVHDLDLARVERLHQARLSLGSNLV